MAAFVLMRCRMAQISGTIQAILLGASYSIIKRETEISSFASTVLGIWKAIGLVVPPCMLKLVDRPRDTGGKLKPIEGLRFLIQRIRDCSNGFTLLVFRVVFVIKSTRAPLVPTCYSADSYMSLFWCLVLVFLLFSCRSCVVSF